MNIEIEYVQIIRKKEKWIKIMGVNALKYSDLPLKYLEGFPHVVLSSWEQLIIRKTGFDVDIRAFQLDKSMPYSEFKECLCIIKQAGKRLAAINKDKQLILKDWNGIKKQISI